MTDKIGDAFAKRKIKGLRGLSFASYEMGWLDAKADVQDLLNECSHVLDVHPYLVRGMEALQQKLKSEGYGK